MPVFLADAPADWDPALAGDPGSALGPEQCVIREERWFLRGNLVVPVTDAEDDLVWGVWLAVSEGTFDRATELWQNEGRVREPPYPGWLATALPGYDRPTLGMLARLRHRPVGLRPLVVLHQSDHPLAVEQREGITAARAEELASLVRVGRPSTG